MVRATEISVAERGVGVLLLPSMCRKLACAAGAESKCRSVPLERAEAAVTDGTLGGVRHGISSILADVKPYWELRALTGLLRVPAAGSDSVPFPISSTWSWSVSVWNAEKRNARPPDHVS